MREQWDAEHGVQWQATERAAGPRRHRRASLGPWLLVVLLFLAITAGGAYVYASPYLTVTKVRRAAQLGDAETVNSHVDFPALRESIRGAMKAAIAKKMISEPPSDPFGWLGSAFGLLLADKMIDALVDGMVTPEGVQTMIAGQPPRPHPTQEPTSPQSQPSASDDTEVRMHYESYNRFVVIHKNKADPKKEFTQVWQRHGLTWKLSAIRVPASGAFGL